MNSTEKLPEGIEALRELERNNGAPISRRIFNKLVSCLERCASTGKPKATKCQICQHLSECLSRFDAVCGRVAMYGDEEEPEASS